MTRKTIIITLGLIIGLINTQASYSQIQHLPEVWSSFKVDTRIWEDWGISYNLEYRAHLNQMNVKDILFDIEAYDDLNKYFKIEYAHRFLSYGIFGTYNGSSTLFQRDALALTFKEEKKRFEFSFRTRFQTGYYQFTKFSGSLFSELTHRNRMEAEYNFKKTPHKGYISLENFVKIKQKEYEFEKWRFKLGDKYKINDSVSADFSYFIERPFNIKNAIIYHVFNIQLKVKFDT
ncbi:DUF2490 domain-containing protein [Saccharicrinis sp. FJH54]|uniref:DUF2490 domain-containing protein n=1 Tax=Saccharicrinis sp. FJH54 TaxID=3344665 RepID=UPI0035D4927D